MTPDEKDLLSRFLQQLTAAQAGQKDEEAARLIKEACDRQPDAAYLLVQRALQLDQAFQASQAQAMKLQAELDQTRVKGSGGFLNDPNAWGSRPTQPSVAQATSAASPAASLAAGASPAASHAAPARAAPSPWGGSNLLGTMAAGAAGMVAGSFLYQGMQGLMNRNDSNAAAKPQQTADAAQDQPHTSGPLEQDDPADTYADSGDDSGGDAGGDFA